MTTLRCKSCGGELEKGENGVYRCLFCDTEQILEYDPEDIDAFLSSKAVDNVYVSAIKLIAIKKYEDALKLLLQIKGYKDADKKIEICRKEIAEEISKEKYKKARLMFERAKSEKDYRQIAEILSEIPAYKDSSALLSRAVKQAELLYKEETYNYACSLIDEGNIHFLMKAKELFGEIPYYKDSSEKKAYCAGVIRKLESQINYRNEQLKKIRAKEKLKKRMLITAVILFLLLLVWVKSLT